MRDCIKLAVTVFHNGSILSWIRQNVKLRISVLTKLFSFTIITMFFGKAKGALCKRMEAKCSFNLFPEIGKQYFTMEDLLVETKKIGWLMEEISSRLNDFILKYAGEATPAQEAVWNQWLEFQPCYPEILQVIRLANINEVFKARALTVLLCFDKSLLPFKWELSFPKNPCLVEREDFGIFRSNPALSDLGTELVKYFIYKIRREAELSSASYSGIALDRYNNFVLNILPLVADEEKEKELFGCFSLKGYLWASCYEEYKFEYHPFWTLLKKDDIPVKWKWRAEERMHSIIRDELAARISPSHLVVSGKIYVNQLVSTWGRLKKRETNLPYDKEIFLGQVHFCFDSGICEYMNGNEAIQLAVVLHDIGYGNHEVCLKLIRFALLEAKEPCILSGEYLEMAQILRDNVTGWGRLTDILTERIQERIECLELERRQWERRCLAKREILARMM